MAFTVTHGGILPHPLSKVIAATTKIRGVLYEIATPSAAAATSDGAGAAGAGGAAAAYLKGLEADDHGAAFVFSALGVAFEKGTLEPLPVGTSRPSQCARATA